MKKNYIQGLLTISCLFLFGLRMISQTCTVPSAPVISGATLAPCTTSNSFTLTAGGASTLGTGWYPFSYGGNAINTGSVFVTPTLTSGATYYVGQTSTVATGSIGLPTYVSTYNGNTRGMWFTAPTSFIITGVRVPTDIGTGNSSIAIMKFPTVPPTYASTTNSFNLLYYVTNVPGTTIIPVYIPVYAGDVIGVLGCRANGTTYATSYAAAGPYTSSLGSYSLSLSRLGMQYTLATTSPQDIWTEASSVGRIELYTSIGCLSTLTPVTVTVTPSPQINITGPPISICAGASTTLNASGVTSYTWANNGSNSSSIVVSPNTTTTYTVSGSISPTCSSSSTINVVVNGGVPSLTATASSNTVCLGGSVTLTGSGANTYTWSGGVSNAVAFSPTATSAYTLTGTNACGNSSIVTTVSISPLPVTAISSSSVVCASSIVSLTASGANTFTWLPGSYTGSMVTVSPASNTTYTVNGNLGNCIGSNTIAVATNPNPTVNIIASASTVCQGDPVTMTASGGISYTWSPVNSSAQSITVNPTSPTAYSVGATNSFGCTSGTVAVVITNPSPTVTATSNTNLMCIGESATLQASGASSYVWSSGNTNTVTVESPTISTIFTVTGTQSGCSSSQTVEVDVFNPTVSITGPTVICMGESATLTANGATSYTWLPNSPFQGITVNPVSTTIYSVSANTASQSINCPSSNTIQITVNPNPTLTLSGVRTTICKNETTTLTASGASTYSWIGASNNYTGTTVVVTSSLITTLTYTVIGTDANGCKNTSNIQVKINGCAGISEYNANALQLNLYPNPNNGEFNLEAETTMELNLINELGQVIKVIRLNQDNNYKTKVQGLTSGVYFILSQNTNQAFNRKLVVE